MKLNNMVIITGLVCLIMGLALGYWFAKSMVEEKKVALEKRSENATTSLSENATALLGIENSSVLDNITAQFRGEITEIEENFLLVKKGSDSLKGEIGDFTPSVTKIRLTESGEKKLVDQKFEFQDIKKGDKVIVNCVLRKGHWQIIGVTIEEAPPKSQG